MPEGFVQVAPDSTGKMLRTRQRVVGANTVQEQYVITSPSDAVPINRVWATTLRIPGRNLAATTGTQILASIWNGIAGGGNNVSVRRLTAEVDTIGAYSTAAPIMRLFRTTAAATGGTVITPVSQYLADPAFNSLVSVRADHQADLAVATTQLAQTGLATQPLWAQPVPRAITAVGYAAPVELNLMPNDANLMAVDPLVLRPSEGAAVQFINGGTATTATINFTFTIKMVLAEFTYP